MSERIMMESYAASIRATAASSVPARRSLVFRALRNCRCGSARAGVLQPTVNRTVALGYVLCCDRM